MDHTAREGRGQHGRVLNALGSQIVSGQLPAETLLDAAALEATFEVSRSVIREALRSLGSRGMVSAVSGQGTFVTDRRTWTLLDPVVLRWQYENRNDLTFLEQLTELRLTLEPTSARLAAQRRTDSDVAELSAAVDAMAQDGAGEAHIQADLRFHRTLLLATHNEFFENLFGVIEMGLRARDLLVHTAINFEVGQSLAEVTAAHRQVLDAVRAGRPRAAEMAMRQLLQRAAADVERARQPTAPGATA